MRAPHPRTFRTQILLPAGLLAVAALASFAMFLPGADAGASGHADATIVSTNAAKALVKACGPVNTRGVSPRSPTRATRSAAPT